MCFAFGIRPQNGLKRNTVFVCATCKWTVWLIRTNLQNRQLECTDTQTDQRRPDDIYHLMSVSEFLRVFTSLCLSLKTFARERKIAVPLKLRTMRSSGAQNDDTQQVTLSHKGFSVQAKGVDQDNTCFASRSACSIP